MGCASSAVTKEQQLQAAQSRRVHYGHDLSCRDPLLACMALVGAAELAHVAGCRTPPLTPMMMHYVNTAATDNDVEVASVSLDAYPNWWRSIKWSTGVSSGNGHVTGALKGSLSCWRRLRVTHPHDLRQLAVRAPKLTHLELSDPASDGQTAFPVNLPLFPHLVKLSVNTSVNFDTLWQSVPALTRLECSDQEAADWSALAMLPQLRFLKLQRVPNLTNEDIDAVSRCRRLQELILSECFVPDISRLSACRELQHLDAQDRWVVASTAVAVCCAVPTCRKLALHNPTLDDMRRLTQLERVIEVALRVTSSDDVIQIATELVTIDPKGKTRTLHTELLNPSWPLRITTLTLHVATDCDTRNFDVTPLAELPALTHLNVEASGHTRVTGSLQGARALKYLAMTCVVETAFADGLFAVRTLEELHLALCPDLRAVNRLDECPAIRVAGFRWCGFSRDALREMCVAWHRLRDLHLIACLHLGKDVGLELSRLLTDGVVHRGESQRFAAPMEAVCRTWYRPVDDASGDAMRDET